MWKKLLFGFLALSFVLLLQAAGEYRFPQNAAFSREIAAPGMVLLENKDNFLPLVKGDTVAIFGRGQLKFYGGGTGSGAVHPAYQISVPQGLAELDKAGFIKLNKTVLNAYRKTYKQTEKLDFLQKAAKESRKALFIISRTTGENNNRKAVPGDYYLSKDEKNTLSLMLKAGFKQIGVIVNSGGIVDLSWVKRHSEIKSVLFIWQPGMEGGRAVADVLSGKVNPSGRLADTIAVDYSAYPTAKIFGKYTYVNEYEEDIFVGYRYFSTIPQAADKVLYPFGYGLSYSKTGFTVTGFRADEREIRIRVKVSNLAGPAVREVVQIYSAPPQKTALDYPAKELRAFVKTPEIAPGKSVEVEVVFPADNLCAFDDTGISGAPVGSFVREAGDHRILLGRNVRDTQEAGIFHCDKLKVLATPGILLQNGPARRMKKDGSFVEYGLRDKGRRVVGNRKKQIIPPAPIMLQDVAAGKHTLAEFIAQLSMDELGDLSVGQPKTFGMGCGGIGNLWKYGVPNLQTCDGPCGVRVTTLRTTMFPCATLLACTWDPELQYRFGKVFGNEITAFGFDVILGPGVNLHRDIFCGRNFEYFSEDPLLAGKSCAAVVRGLQDGGAIAEVKHLTANNSEIARQHTDSTVSERALRELYLKPFEITVREAQPGCIMTSYNFLNGVKTSCNYNLLETIVRGEWGYRGLFTTDWLNVSLLMHEVMAGNDVKMSCAPITDVESLERLRHHVNRSILERNAGHILQTIMRSYSFKKGKFGNVVKVEPGKALQLVFNSFNNRNSGSVVHCKDFGGAFLSRMQNCGRFLLPTELTWFLEVKETGKYQVKLRMASESDQLIAALNINRKNCWSVPIPQTMKPGAKALPPAKVTGWQEFNGKEITLPAGRTELTLAVSNMVRGNCDFANFFSLELIPVK